MKVGADELRAILRAYKQVVDASWRDLHPAMASRAGLWNTATEAELRKELDGYLHDSSRSDRAVRVFYKLGTGLVFAGCNEHFARDAGLPLSEVVGLDDFSDKIPWAAQAAKYRADDREVVDTNAAKLDILERQTAKSGVVTWVHVGKAPITNAAGSVLGILGMYEILDDKTAQRLFLERSRATSPR